jgi:hypothetical protein
MKGPVGLASAPAAGLANGAHCAPYGKTFQEQKKVGGLPLRPQEKLFLARRISSRMVL